MRRLPDELIAYTLKDYCCSKCWGMLDLFYRDGQDVIECAKYGSEHAGFVRQGYANRRRDDSAADLMDVNELMQQLGLIDDPHKGKTAQQLLEEMGF